MAGEGFRIWAEWCPSFADEFVSKARRGGVKLDYSRGSLSAVEDLLYEELRDIKTISLHDSVYDLIKMATAYLSEVIVRNIGGRPNFDNQIMQATVEDVGIRGLKALPEAKIGWLTISDRDERKLEWYYDRLRATSEILRSTPAQVDKERVWGRLLNYVETCREALKFSIWRGGKLEMLLTPFVWCPSCDHIPLVAARIVGPEDVIKMRFKQIVYKLLYETSGNPCNKCGGLSFPLGYGLNYVKLIPRSSTAPRIVGRLLSSRPKVDEYYLTVVSTTIGKTLALYNLVRRQGDTVVEISEDRPNPLEGIQNPFLVRLPDTPFYV